MNDDLKNIVNSVNALKIVINNMYCAVMYNTHTDSTNWLADDSGLDPEMLAIFDNTQKTLLEAFPPNRISKEQVADILSLI